MTPIPLTYLLFLARFKKGDNTVIKNKAIIIKDVSNVVVVDNNYTAKKRTFSGIVPHNELIYKVSGETKILFDNDILYDRVGSIRFLPKIEKNIIYTTETIKNGVCIDIFFDTLEPIYGGAFTIDTKHSNLIRQLFWKAYSSWCRKEEGYGYEVKGYLYEIFAELQRSNSNMPEDKYHKIVPGVKYMHENFTSNFPMEILGDKCSISYSYFRKLFASKFGISPKKYILNLRINRAIELLKTDLYSITAISEILGYQNEYYFSRSFKEAMGVSPSLFKKESQYT